MPAPLTPLTPLTTPTALISEGCCCPVVEVHIQEDLDLASVPRIREQLYDALSLSPDQLVVDLGACTFFDGCGITMLLEVHRQAWRQDARLTLRRCTQRQLHVLDLMGLGDVFEIEMAGSEQR